MKPRPRSPGCLNACAQVRRSSSPKRASRAHVLCRWTRRRSECWDVIAIATAKCRIRSSSLSTKRTWRPGKVRNESAVGYVRSPLGISSRSPSRLLTRKSGRWEPTRSGDFGWGSPSRSQKGAGRSESNRKINAPMKGDRKVPSSMIRLGGRNSAWATSLPEWPRRSRSRRVRSRPPGPRGA